MKFSTSSRRTSLSGLIRSALTVAMATVPLRYVQPSQSGITDRNRKFIMMGLAGY